MDLIYLTLILCVISFGIGVLANTFKSLAIVEPLEKAAEL